MVDFKIKYITVGHFLDTATLCCIVYQSEIKAIFVLNGIFNWNLPSIHIRTKTKKLNISPEKNTQTS